MNNQMIHRLMAAVQLINTNLDTAPGSWRNQVQAIRSITSTLELTDRTPDNTHRGWQVAFIYVAQRVAFADADNGSVTDVADWCLRQLLALLTLYPNDVEILNLIGRNWLLRAQKALASIARAEDGPLYRDQSNSYSSHAATQRLNDAHYVEARGLLLPATDYLQRAVEAARVQGNLTGPLVVTAAEAFMSLGNVTSPRVHHDYFRRAIGYLRAATQIEGYALPYHMQQYLEDYGIMYDDA